MRNGGRIAAAIDVLNDVLTRHQPVKSAARDWGKRARYAGSKDRAWVSGLVLDALRKRNSIAHAMGDDSPRALILGALAHAWGWNIRQIDDAMDEDHAPSKLTLDERERLVMAPDPVAPPHVQGDYPEWMAPMMARVFGEEAAVEARQETARAERELGRANGIKQLLAEVLVSVVPVEAGGEDPGMMLGILERTTVRLDQGGIEDPLARAEIEQEQAWLALEHAAHLEATGQSGDPAVAARLAAPLRDLDLTRDVSGPTTTITATWIDPTGRINRRSLTVFRSRR